MEFIEVKTEKDCEIADSLLTELIKFESDIDKVINKNFIVKDFYSKIINKHTNMFCVYAQEDNQVLGYIYAYLKNPIGSVTFTNIICLDALYVKEEYRKQGIGKKLMGQLEIWANKNYE